MKEIELIDKRKPREKHFLQEDGTIIARVYNSDIHYLKNGKYEEIDNTLIRENGCYCNKCNSYKVKYFEDKEHTLMRVEKNKYFLEISLKEANALKIKETNSSNNQIKDLLYEEVLEGIDIEYKTLSNKVKETIILHNNQYKNIGFIINTNLRLKQKDKVIEAYDGIKCIFKFDKPFMQDSKGEYNYNLTYELIENNSNYELKLKLDDEWLKSPETIYPVYIDPTISNVGEEVNLYDTYIYQGDTNAERYNEEFLKAGVEQKNDENIINRTLIKFDLPEIGTGSNIISAYLQLVPYPTTTEYPTERIATIHRITEDWNDTTATWENMNNKFDSHIENIYYLHRSTISNNLIIPGFINDGDITSLVKKWYSDTPNYGLMIKSADEENYVDDDYPMFYSKDNNVQGDYNPKPVVSIVYRNENGIENYLDYKTQSFSNGSALINTNNGNLTTIFDIGHTVGGNLPINLGIVYNTNDVILQKSGKFGIGYKLTFEQTLKPITIDSNNYLEYLDEDGTIHYLYKKELTEEYYDEDGLGLKVSKSENICMMTDSRGNELTFTKLNDIYYLTKIQDCDNNFIDIILNSDNSINKLVDRFGSSITITYNETNIEINSPSTSSKLNYTNGLLTSIESECGTTPFTYNEQKLITSIIDVTGIKIVYDYYEEKPYKVKKVTQHGLNNEEGQFFLLEYGYNTTKITDNKGRIETIIYDAAGNVASKNSMSSNEDIETAYSITQAVGDSDSGDKNKILSSVIPVRYIKNYLKNTSFEQDVDYFTYDSGITKEYSLEEFCSGYRSLKLTSIIENQSIEQSINVSKGKHYTFSGFFKTNVTAKITLSYTNSNNEVVISSKELESANEFERDDITIYYDENAISDLKIKITLQGIGTIYIDDLQLEEGEVANGYNVIENSDFSEGLSDWTIEGWTFDESEIEPSDYYETIKFNNNKNTALKISMNPLIGTRIYKELPIKGKKR